MASYSWSENLAEFVSDTLGASRALKQKPLAARVRASCYRLLFLVGVVLPIVSVFLSVLLGAPLAVIEGWSFQDCFFIILAELSATSITLTDDDDTPETHIGRLVAAVISMIALGMFGVVVGILGGPLLDPLIQVFRLTVPDEDSKYRASKSIGKLAGLLFLGLPILAIVLSAIFGGMLAVTEGWKFSDSFYTIMVELSATNIELVEANLYPESFIGKLVAAFISLWALAIFAAVLGVAGGPLCFAAMNMDPESELSVRQCMVRMCLFITVGLPLISTSISVLFACLLSALEGWEYENCLFLVLMNLAACGIQFTDDAMVPDSDVAKLAAAFTGMVGLALFAACLVILGGIYMQPFSSIFGFKEVARHPSPFLHAFKMLMLVIFGVMPLLAITLSLVFGIVLSGVEEWSVDDGFYVLLTEVSGTGIELVNFGNLPVESLHGKFFGAFSSLWTLAIFAGIIGVIAGDIVSPLMDMTDVDFAPPERTSSVDTAAEKKASGEVSDADVKSQPELPIKGPTLDLDLEQVVVTNKLEGVLPLDVGTPRGGTATTLGNLSAEEKTPPGQSEEHAPLPAAVEDAPVDWAPDPAGDEANGPADEEEGGPPRQPTSEDSPEAAAGGRAGPVDGTLLMDPPKADGHEVALPPAPEPPAPEPSILGKLEDAVLSPEDPASRDQVLENTASDVPEPQLDEELVEMWFNLHTEVAMRRLATVYSHSEATGRLATIYSHSEATGTSY